MREHIALSYDVLRTAFTTSQETSEMGEYDVDLARTLWLSRRAGQAKGRCYGVAIDASSAVLADSIASILTDGMPTSPRSSWPMLRYRHVSAGRSAFRNGFSGSSENATRMTNGSENTSSLGTRPVHRTALPPCLDRSC